MKVLCIRNSCTSHVNFEIERHLDSQDSSIEFSIELKTFVFHKDNFGHLDGWIFVIEFWKSTKFLIF